MSQAGVYPSSRHSEDQAGKKKTKKKTGCHFANRNMNIDVFVCALFVVALFWSARLFISGLHGRKSERSVLPVWTLVNRLQAWENVKAPLWSWLLRRISESPCAHVCLWMRQMQGLCLTLCVCVCDTVYPAHRAIFISHLCRPRKCSESWLTVIFSVSAWQRCADIHRRAAHAATCRVALWKLGGEAATLPNCIGVAHVLLASSVVFYMPRTVASAVTQRRGRHTMNSLPFSRLSKEK